MRASPGGPAVERGLLLCGHDLGTFIRPQSIILAFFLVLLFIKVHRLHLFCTFLIPPCLPALPEYVFTAHRRSICTGCNGAQVMPRGPGSA